MSTHGVEHQDERVKFDIPALTFIKIFVALIIAFALIKLYPLILLIFLSALLAFATAPLVNWMQKKGLKRGFALSLVVFVMVGLAAAFIFLLLPELFSQVSSLGEKIGPLKQEAMNHMPQGPLRNYVGKTIEHPDVVLGNLPNYFTTIGVIIFNSLWSVAVFLIVAIYFLIDGQRAYQWILGFFKPSTQFKLNRTVSELEGIVSAYVGGQFITSTIVGVFVFALHSILGVPGALMLAFIAALFDVLPIVGFMASTVCAFIMAMTVSPSVALLVVVLYLAYQAFENYVIVPRVYGRKMKLSTLVVLLSFLVAAELAGVAGAILVLPIVAAYPVIEKIWLRRYLGEQVVQTHVEQLKDPKDKPTEPKPSLKVPALE